MTDFRTIETFRLVDWEKIDAITIDWSPSRFLAEDWEYRQPTWPWLWDMSSEIYDPNLRESEVAFLSWWNTFTWNQWIWINPTRLLHISWDNWNSPIRINNSFISTAEPWWTVKNIKITNNVFEDASIWNCVDNTMWWWVLQMEWATTDANSAVSLRYRNAWSASNTSPSSKLRIIWTWELWLWSNWVSWIWIDNQVWDYRVKNWWKYILNSWSTNWYFIQWVLWNSYLWYSNWWIAFNMAEPPSSWNAWFLFTNSWWAALASIDAKDWTFYSSKLVTSSTPSNWQDYLNLQYSSISKFSIRHNNNVNTNSSIVIWNTYHLWVDSSWKLRIKSSTPTSDTDWTIVWTQS